MAGGTARPEARLCNCELRRPVALPVGSPLRDAARLMRDEDISCVLVGAPGELVSILTERDLTKALADGATGDTAVESYAASNPLTVSSEATVRHAAALMLYYGVRHLVVTSENQAVGVISMRDALASLVDSATPESFVVMVHEALETRPDSWWG
jgi:CBS domain-containing protein